MGKSPSEDQHLLKISQVSQWLGVTESTIYRWVDLGHFPKGLVLGNPDDPTSAVRYERKEIEEWLALRPRQKTTVAKGGK